MNLNLIWRGGFVNVGPHWNGRGSGSTIAGFDRINLVDGMALQTLPSPDTPWIPHSKDLIAYQKDTPIKDMKKQITIGVPHPDYHFIGYRLDQKRFPTFSYKFKELSVTDTFSPQVEKNLEALNRTLTFSGTPPKNTHLLLASGAKYKISNDGWIDTGTNLSFKISGATPFIRNANTIDPKTLKPSNRKQNQVLVPVPANAKLNITYKYKTTIAGRPE